MKKPPAISSFPAATYSRLRQAVGAQLTAGVRRVEKLVQEELVRMHWNVGRELKVVKGLGDKPSAANARLIGQLSADLGRPDCFFYDAAKFYRYYPKAPPKSLNWTQCTHLLRVSDPDERRTLEERIRREGLKSRALRILMRVPAASSLVNTADGKVPVERGRLYHYRVSGEPVAGRVMLDVGFGIEREVRCTEGGSLHTGLIVRAVKEGEDYTVRISSPEQTRLYTYRATLKRVVDGDTIVACIDLGFRTWITQTLRLRGIDTPEVSCAAGLKARAEVRARLEACRGFVVRTYKEEKYGRMLADVFCLKDVDDPQVILERGVFLNQELVDCGLAVLYDGGAK